MTNLELYLIFPLNNEASTIALVRGTMATGGVVLLGLLAAIALLVARQIVLPVRSASRIAERFAEGHLTERMPVRGEDDMARLAVSFNDMAESLSRQITQLEEFGNLQRGFTSDVSHELRTPLTTVRMAADLIYDHSEELEPALRRSTELMVNELDRFETLLADLLEISRHDAGVAELSVESVDLRSTVEGALDRRRSPRQRRRRRVGRRDARRTPSSPRSIRAASSAFCATSSPTPSITPSASRCASAWRPMRTPSQ